MKKRRTDFRRMVKAAEQETLEILVDLFDWLDGLEPQPTADIVPHHLILTNQGVAKKVMGFAVSYPHCFHMAPETYPHPGLDV